MFSCSVMSESLWPHDLQHTRLPCPSLSPGVCPNSWPWSQWCYLSISSSVTPFPFCPQFFPVSGFCPTSWLFASGGQSIGASASASVLPMNIQSWLPFSSVSVQSLSCAWLFVTPWTTALQASRSIINSQSLPKLMSMESVMPSNHLILCRPLLLLPSIFPSIRIFSNESALRMRWPKYWSFSFSISPSNEYSEWFPLGLTGLIALQSKGLSRVFSSTTIWKHQFFSTQPSLWSNSHIHIWLLEKPYLWV